MNAFKLSFASCLFQARLAYSGLTCLNFRFPPETTAVRYLLSYEVEMLRMF